MSTKVGFDNFVQILKIQFLSWFLSKLAGFYPEEPVLIRINRLRWLDDALAAAGQVGEEAGGHGHGGVLHSTHDGVSRHRGPDKKFYFHLVTVGAA